MKQETNTRTPYPVAPGHKRDGASLEAARNVSRDPDRKMTTYTDAVLEILMGSNLVTDDLCAILQCHWTYLRPRVSELIAMNVLRQGSIKARSSLTGRSAHVLEPTDGLLDFLSPAAHLIDSVDFVRPLIRGFIERQQIAAIMKDRAETARRAGQMLAQIGGLDA